MGDAPAGCVLLHVGGSSVGIGTWCPTLHVEYEREVVEILGIPSAAVPLGGKVPVGYTPWAPISRRGAGNPLTRRSTRSSGSGSGTSVRLPGPVAELPVEE